MYAGKVVNLDYLISEVKRLNKENLSLREAMANNPIYKARIKNKIDELSRKTGTNEIIWTLQSLLD